MNQLFPTSLAPNIAELLPKQPLYFKGPTLASISTMLYLSLITVRSLLHLLLPDGGAQSIATIDVSGASGVNIIAIFGQWGASQLLLAGLLWLLILRYPGFISLALLVLANEDAGRVVDTRNADLQCLTVVLDRNGLATSLVRANVADADAGDLQVLRRNDCGGCHFDCCATD